nr:hypothetical protein [Tanacetum cinerariifolium]
MEGTYISWKEHTSPGRKRASRKGTYTSGKEVAFRGGNCFQKVLTGGTVSLLTTLSGRSIMAS